MERGKAAFLGQALRAKTREKKDKKGNEQTRVENE